MHTKKVPRSLRTHHFDPFLEISHRLQLIIHFKASVAVEPLTVEFPIIITDFPPNTTADYFIDPALLSPVPSTSTTSTDNGSIIMLPPASGSIQPGADEVSCVDLDLPEYTPRYEESSTTGSSPSTSSATTTAPPPPTVIITN